MRYQGIIIGLFLVNSQEINHNGSQKGSRPYHVTGIETGLCKDLACLASTASFLLL